MTPPKLLALVFSLAAIYSGHATARAEDLETGSPHAEQSSPSLPEGAVRLTLEEAEKSFRENNLDLLAAKFGIEAANALRLQATLWQNPNLQLEQNIYNPKTGKFFDVTKTGNTEFQFTQLIQLAGKHGKLIKLADFDKKLSQNQFFELVRTLKFQLRTTFFKLFWQQQALRFFDKSVSTITKTIQSAQVAYEKRSLLLAEVLRLKTLLSQLQSDRLDVVTDIANAQSDLRTLIFNQNSSKKIIADMDPTQVLKVSLSMPLEEVLKTARQNRPDLKILDEAVQREEVNLSLQRTNVIPDLTLGVRYSRAGSYIPEYFGFLVGFNIPLFDQNQGNIRASEAQRNLKQAQHKRALMDLEHDIEASYSKTVEADKVVRQLDANFLSDYDGLVDKMVLNYERRNIGIIAFADFYESYRNGRLQYQSMQLKRLNAFEELNLNAGTSVVDILESQK